MAESFSVSLQPCLCVFHSAGLVQWIWQVCCWAWRTVCRASLCSGLGHILLILNHQQVQWSLAPVVYRLWNSHLYATSVKQLTSCLWNCTSLGTIKHESLEWNPHGKIEGIDFWLPRGRKTYFPPLLPSVCPGVLRSLVWCCIGENRHGFLLHVCSCKKKVFGKQILKSLFHSFCFICKSQRENCRSAYVVFRSCRGLMMLQCGCMKPHCCFLCCVNGQMCANHPGVCQHMEKGMSHSWQVASLLPW